MSKQKRDDYWKKRSDKFKEQGLCARCGKSPSKEGIMFCESCSDKGKTRSKTYGVYQRRRDTGVCVVCGKDNPFKTNVICIFCFEKRDAVRKRVLDHYGNACSCCGESISDFLEVDHVDNNGAKHRKELGIAAGRAFYKWLIENNFPEGFQLLCCNCNKGKYRNGGVCPHQKAQQLEDFGIYV